MFLGSLPFPLLRKEVMGYIQRVLNIRETGHLQSVMVSLETQIFLISSTALSTGVMGKKRGQDKFFFNNLFFLIIKVVCIMFLLENVGNLGEHKKEIKNP